MGGTKRKQYEILRSSLDNERSSFMSHWRDLADYIRPRRARFTLSETNRGDKKNQKIVDATATLSSRTLRSGMMSGVTSPARPWFRLTTPDPDLAESGPVKDWLYFVGQRMNSVFLKCNLYNVLPIIYGDIGDFGTSAMFIEEDFQDTVRCYAFPIASYYVANNSRQKVDVFLREFRMTVRQLVEKFGERNEKTGKPDWSNFSSLVKNLYEQNKYDEWIDVTHVIQPNEEFNPLQLNSKFKRYSSCYFETGAMGSGSNYLSQADEDKYLRESGYDFFPVLCPRWEISDGDAYGTDCPGMTALGDIKALMTMQKRKAQAIDKMVNPPMVGPTSLKNAKATILPGDITFLDERSQGQGFRPAHEVNFRIGELSQDILAHQQRIQRAYYEDLFLMLSQTDRRNITAREIDERHEEKLLALGPVLEQLNQDLLDPLIDIVFDRMMKQGQIPEPPEDLHGVDLRVEYISIMAQAQKFVGIASIERFAGFASQVAAVNPAALDKIDTDQILDVYGEHTSVPPGIVRPDEEVAAIRQERAKQQQAVQMAEIAKQGASAAKDLSQADTGGENVLSQLINNANAGGLVPAQ